MGLKQFVRYGRPIAICFTGQCHITKSHFQENWRFIFSFLVTCMRKSHNKTYLTRLVGVAVMLLVYIQEMPGCDPDWAVWCPGRLSWLSSAPLVKCWYSPSLRLQLLPFIVFPVYYSWIVLQMMLCSSRGIQIFQKSRATAELWVLDGWKYSQFHSEDPQICAVVRNLVMQVTWCQEFVHPYCVVWVTDGIAK